MRRCFYGNTVGSAIGKHICAGLLALWTPERLRCLRACCIWREQSGGWDGWITEIRSRTQTIWAGARDHDFSPSRRDCAGKIRADPAGHSGTCGFFRGDGAGALGAGLRGAGYQRHRRFRVIPDAVEIAGAAGHTLHSLCQQDGHFFPRRRGADGGIAPGALRELRGYDRLARAGLTEGGEGRWPCATRS